MLKFAHLCYGSSLVLVEATEACPLPQEFDFQDPETCAKSIFAMMSTQSGGFTLTNCKLCYDQERRSANLTANGVHVYYQDDSAPKFTLEQAVAYAANFPGVVRQLGHVKAGESSSGWKKALWRSLDVPAHALESQAPRQYH